MWIDDAVGQRKLEYYVPAVTGSSVDCSDRDAAYSSEHVWVLDVGLASRPVAASPTPWPSPAMSLTPLGKPSDSTRTLTISPRAPAPSARVAKARSVRRERNTQRSARWRRPENEQRAVVVSRSCRGGARIASHQLRFQVEQASQDSPCCPQDRTDAIGVSDVGQLHHDVGVLMQVWSDALEGFA